MEEKYHQRLLEHTGKRIRFYRKLCNMSQDQLAAAIYKSESTLSKYERGAISPDVVTLYDIAHALNIDAYQLLDYEAPTQAAQIPSSHLFGGCTKLHFYYHLNKEKRFEHSVIELFPPKDGDMEIPCRCYIEIPPSGAYEDCSYYHTGSMISHETATYMTLQNNPVKAHRMNIFIQNPFMNNACAWGVIAGFAFSHSALYFYKILVSPEPLSISDLDPEEFHYSKEDMQLIRQLSILPLNSPVK